MLIRRQEAFASVACSHPSGDTVVITMVRDGRSLCTVSITFILCIFSTIQNASTEYGIPIEIKSWDSKRNPLSHMVDVTNEFGIKILAEHNFLNKNNIAFSPYGLMGIMVALYEGVDGESSYQIQRSMQLPWNRNVMRIGFRDIHRTLKTYFVPEEGFLAGLALNNDNVTFNESYKKILRFYGFDLDQPNNNNTTTLLPNDGSADTNSTTTIEMMNDVVTTTTEPTKETTLNPNAETIDTRDSNSETTSIAPLATETESQSITPTKTNTVEQVVVTILTEIPTSTAGFSTESTLPYVTLTSMATESTTMQPTTDSTTMSLEMTLSTLENTITTKDVALETTNNITTDLTTNSIVDIITTPTEGTSTMPDSSPTEGISNADETTVTSTTSSTSTLETLERRKKSVYDFILNNLPYDTDYPLYRSFDVGIELPQEHSDEDKMFLVNGLRNIQVSYMHYDSILEHAYLPHLEASALRLPLDSDHYYLLVVLPLRRGEGEVTRLLARMARESDLSDVYAALRPRRVKAVVPSFTVKGHITLTTDLQKLGVSDVFEPRQNDFTPMTNLAGVYVRSIEQAVSVVIRKYQPDSLKNKYISNRNPVVFSATYPFLYFVMDTTINVALMAGKMVDPLNTRIL